jgi:hypothetical protein
MDEKCSCCDEPGRSSQGPWPLPMSGTYCNDCHELEGMAYSAWRELNPKIHKFNAPIPFMKNKADWPPDAYNKSAAEIKEFFKLNMEDK